MKKERAKKRVLCLLFSIILFAVSVVGIYDSSIPSSVTVSDPMVLQTVVNIPFASVIMEDPQAEEALAGCTSPITSIAHVMLFNSIPIKDIEVSLTKRINLIPGGMSFGIKLFMQGVLIVGISEIDTDAKRCSPAEEAGLKVQDMIVRINGSEVNTAQEVTDYISGSNGAPLKVTVLRNEREHECTMTPVLCGESGYKAGLWIRDNTAGIGTVTYIDPETLAFAGLGHGVCDVDTGVLIPMRYGIVSGATLTGIVRGQVGAPGEFKGFFTGNRIGMLTANTRCGVYGTLNALPNLSDGKAIPIAFHGEVHTGAAEILCTNSDNCVNRYQIKILEINRSKEDTRNFIIEVTDPTLLALTGGIIQGMSGSPIIQDGRLIGAVTHVLVNDPTKGYGIFIENMLKNAA